MEGAAADAELFCRQSPVFAALRQRLADQECLHLGEVHAPASRGPGIKGSHGHREIAESKLCTGTEDDGVLYGGAQFPYIARPVIGLERLQGGGGEPSLRLAVFLGHFLEKGRDQHGDVLAVVPQRGHGQRDHVEPEEEILAECPGVDHGGEILVRGGK